MTPRRPVNARSPSSRLARPRDAQIVLALMDAFFDSRGIGRKRPTLERLRQRFSTYIVTLNGADTEPDAVCFILPKPNDVQVALLLPFGLDKYLLAPLIVGGLQELLRRRPESGSWLVWAEFPFTADLGRGDCLAWQEVWPQTRVAQRESDSLYRIEYTVAGLVQDWV